MFTYKLDCRLCDPRDETNSALRLHSHPTPATISIGLPDVDIVDNARKRSDNGTQPTETSESPSATLPERQITKYPLLWIPKVKNITRKCREDETDNKAARISSDVETTTDNWTNFHQINVRLDFGQWFTWLERGIWVTMIASIAWALSLDTSKAISEVCYKNGKEFYPFNILPSLSRTMGSFRIGTLFWTVCMSACFMARLMSNYFLHRLYETWYDTNLFNTIFLRIAYYLDNLEIISLIMIPAYSLECDSLAHRSAFIAYIALTYAAELLQYMTRFLKRKVGIILLTEDVSNYYRQIGFLIILQTFFLLWMLTGFLMHENLCGDFHFTVFTLGEYFTVIVNVRFKRDTILFVR